jgi:hypothetical protein
MTAPDRMPEAFENSLHDAGHPHMEPPTNPERFRSNCLKTSEAIREVLESYETAASGIPFADQLVRLVHADMVL